MGLTYTEIKTEIWISFSNFIRSYDVLPQEKGLAMAFLSEWDLELLERLFYTGLVSFV